MSWRVAAKTCLWQAKPERENKIRTPEERAKRREMRFKKALNVIDSEALYVKRVGLLRDNFMHPMREQNILSHPLSRVHTRK